MVNFLINLTFLTVSFYVAFVLIALGLFYLFYMTFFFISKVIDSLGEYQKIDRTDIRSRRKKIKKIFIAYLWLSLPTYLTVLNLLHPSSDDLGKAFIAILPIIISYLISLRILSNPNKMVLTRFGIRDLNNITKEQNYWVENFKERVHSFYFSLTEGTIFYMIMLILYTLIKDESYENLLGQFIPAISPLMMLIFIISYSLALFIAAVLGEYFLELFQPIRQSI